MRSYGISWCGSHVGVFETTGWDTQMHGTTKLTGRWSPAATADALSLLELLREGSKVEVLIEEQATAVQAWLSIDQNGDARLYVRPRPRQDGPY